jgi:hypothetical protein
MVEAPAFRPVNRTPLKTGFSPGYSICGIALVTAGFGRLLKYS